MRCIGINKNGASCVRDAREGYLTCGAHKALELPTDDAETTLTDGENAPVSPVKTRKSETVTFGSAGANYSYVVVPRKMKIVDGQNILVQEGKRADFAGGKFSTSDPVIIEALRAHIAKFPNDRFLFET